MILPIIFWTLIALCVGLYALLFWGVINAPIRDTIKQAEAKFGKWPL